MTTHDLDALLDEIDDKGPTVTLFGETWDLPADVDAETMLRVQRLAHMALVAQRTGKKPKPDQIIDNDVDLEQLVEAMAGPENYAAWKAKGLGYKKLQAVARELYAIHNGEAGNPGKAKSKRGAGKQTQKRTGTSRSGNPAKR